MLQVSCDRGGEELLVVSLPFEADRESGASDLGLNSVMGMFPTKISGEGNGMLVQKRAGVSVRV